MRHLCISGALGILILLSNSATGDSVSPLPTVTIDDPEALLKELEELKKREKKLKSFEDCTSRVARNESIVIGSEFLRGLCDEENLIDNARIVNPITSDSHLPLQNRLLERPDEELAQIQERITYLQQKLEKIDSDNQIKKKEKDSEHKKNEPIWMIR